MTVSIGVVSANGLVVAADSRTSYVISRDAPQRVLSDFTHKVFRVGECAVATYGWAFLERKTIAGHMAEFALGFRDGEPPTPEGVATALAAFFGDSIERHFESGADPRPPEGHDTLGFIVAGYDNGAGQLWEVFLPSRAVELRAESDTPGAVWRGQTDVIRRLVKGADVDLLTRFASEEGLTEHVDALRPVFEKVEYWIPFGAMNLQDSVDFAVFAIRTTIDVQRLTYGTLGAPGSWPGVGGPIEIAAITPQGGFHWLQRTQLQGERPPGEAEPL